MTYSYTQISHYLSCPRRYKHRYLDGWKEKDTRAAMCLAGHSNKPWLPTSSGRMPPRCSTGSGPFTGRADFTIPSGTAGTAMLQSGVQLLDRFAQDDRIRIRQSRRNLQIKYTKVLAGQNSCPAQSSRQLGSLCSRIRATSAGLVPITDRSGRSG
jgi:hypothetical protein